MWNFKNTITGTLTGVRISAVDGTAFLDNCSALLPYMDGRSRIQLLDSSGRILEGVLGLRGVAETYTSIAINGTFNSNTTGWTCFRGSVNIVAGGYSGNCLESVNNSGFQMYRTIYNALAIHGIYKTSAYVKSGTAGAIPIRVLFTEYNNVTTGTTSEDWTNVSSYITNINVDKNIRLMNSPYSSGTNGLTTLWDECTLEQVLTPSNQGCLIKNDTGVQNFISKNASFTYNAASYKYRVFTDTRI